MTHRASIGLLFLTAAALCFVSGASAAIYTWADVGTDFSIGTNWATNVAPGSGDIGLFNNINPYNNSPAVTQDYGVGGLWDVGSPSLSFGGAKTLTINGATINGNAGAGVEIDAAAGAFYFAAPITLGAAQTWLNNSSNGATFAGNVSMGANQLTLAGNGLTTISGGLSGTAGLAMNGPGTLVLQGANVNYSGNTAVNGGTLQFFNASNFSNGAITGNTLSIASGAVLEMYTDTSGNGGDGTNQILGSNSTTTVSGAGIFRKTGPGILGSAFNGNGQLAMAMSPGGLIDIEAGTLRNGGWSGTTWTNNQASMYIGSGATLDLWDGKPIYVDALNGPGTVNKTQQNGGVIQLTVGVANGSGTFSGIIENTNTNGGSVGLTKLGTGIQVLSGNNTYSGPTTINGGTLQFGNGGATGSIVSSGTVSNNGVLVFSYSGASTNSVGAISGTGSLYQNSATNNAIVTLGGGGTYTGSTYINGGALQTSKLSIGGQPSGIGASTSNAANLVFGGNTATLTYTGTGDTTNRLFTMGGNATINASGAGPLTFSNTAAVPFSGNAAYTLTLGGNTYGPVPSVFSSVLTNNGANPTGLTITGAYWTLSASNTYTGATTITGGVLGFASPAALSPSTSIVLQGGALAVSGPYTTVNGWLSSGLISHSATGALAIVGGTAGVTNNETINMNANGGYAGLSLGAVGSVTYGGVLTPSTVTNTYFLGGGGGTLNVNTTLSGANSALIFPGTVALVQSNSFSGPVTLQSGARLVLSNSGDRLLGSIQLGTGGAGTAVLQFGAPNQLAATSVITNNGSNGNGTYLKLMGNSQTVGGISDTTGAGVIENTETENNVSAATLTVNNAAPYAFNGYLRDTNSGTGVGSLSLVKNGIGTLTLSGGNITYSGSTSVSGGMLVVQDVTNSRFGGGITDNANVNVNSSSTMQFNGATLQGSGTFTKTGAGSLLFGANGSTWTISMAAGSLIDVEGGTLRNEYSNGAWGNNLSSLYVAGSATVDLWDSAGGITVDALNGAGTVQHTSFGGTENFTVGVNGGSGTFSGLITDTSGHALTLVKKGNGTQVLSGNNSYSGGTTLNAGVLSFANGALGFGAVSITGNSTLQWSGGNTQDVSNQLQPVPGGVTLSLDTNGNNVNLATGPSGAGIVRKAGAGTLTLSSPISTGATTVNAGTLALDGFGAISSPTVSVSPGAVVDASTAFAGLTIGSGQTVTAGRTSSPAPDLLGNITLSGGVMNICSGVGTIGTLTTDATSTLALSGGTVNFDLTSTPTSSGGTNDRINAANLALNGATININPVNHSLSNGTYNLFNFSGTLSGGVGNLQLAGVSSNGVRQSFNLVATGVSNAALQLSVSGNAANLLWTGSAGNTWDVTTTPSWKNLGTNSADVFYNNDAVTFSDTAATTNVTINAAVAPGSVTFNNNSLTYTLNSSGFGNRITGLTGLTKMGGGTVILAEDNDYTGQTSINGGVLVLGSVNAVQNSTVGVNANNGLAFLPGVGGSFTLGGLSGSGALALSDTAGGAASLSLGGNGDVTTYSGVIRGPGALVENGPGTLTLTGSNSFSGGLTASGGAVVLGNANAVQASTVEVDAGALNFAAGIGGFNVGGLSGAGAFSLQDTSNSPVTMTVGGNGQSTVFSGTFNGAGSLIKAGSGSLSLQGNGIAYSGNTVVSAGTLQVYNGSNFSNGTISGNTLSIASGAVLEMYTDTTNNAGDGANQILGSDNNTTVSGAGIFRKTGPGILGSAYNANGQLTMAMSPAGLIDIEGGTLRNGGWSGTTWTNNQASMYIAAGATLDLWDGHTVYVNSLSGSGTVDKNQGSGGTVNLTLGVANGSGQFDGVIQNSKTYLSLTKAGSGVQILTGNNTYSGPTTVSGGTLQIGNGGTSGSIDGTSSITNNATLVYNRSDGGTLASAISGGGNLVTTGGGTFVVPVQHTYTGSTTINGGKLQLQLPSPAAVGTPVVWFDPSNSANYSLTGNNVTQLTNLGTAGDATTIAGHGTPTLTVANPAFNGLTTLHFSGGQVLGGYDLSALNGSSYTIFAVEGKASNANLYFLGTVNASQDQGMHFGYRSDTDFTMAQYGDDLDTPTLPSIAYSGSEVAREWTGMLNTSAGRSIYLNGTLEASNNNTNPFNGLGGANFGFIGAGFSYNASYHGDLGEVLIYPSALTSAQRQEVETYLDQKWEPGSTGFLPAATPVTITNGGIFDLNGVNQTIGSLASTDPTTQVTLGGATLTTGNDNTSTTFAGSISGTGGLTKIGSGVFTLTASNGYAGTTSVKGGTLKLGNANALGTSGLLLTGGLLNLNGNSITVPTLDGTGGAISDLAATAGLSTLTVTDSGTFSGSIQNGPSRQLALHMAGSGTLTLSGSNSYTGGTFVDSGTLIVMNPGAIADGTSLTVGDAGAFPAPVVPAPLAGAAVVPVPEPGSLLLLAAGGALLIMIRRLRHSKR